MDLNKILTSLGKVSASMQKDRTKIDTTEELNSYVSGWDAIKAKANQLNNDNIADNDVDMTTLETQMKSELAGLMGADFGNTKGLETKADEKGNVVFTDEEALAGLMNALSESMDAEMTEKVASYNQKHPELAEDTKASMKSIKKLLRKNHKDINNTEKTSFTGFSRREVNDLMDILGDSAPKVFKYMSNAIEDGSADKISEFTHNFDVANEILKAIKDLPQGN